MLRRIDTPILYLLLSGLVVAAPGHTTTYYVDFDKGQDANDGLTPATAWKHAPGDNSSTGTARNMTLQPGDRVLFRGGVRYRSNVMPRMAGTAEAPVVFDGSNWGPGRAIFDGSRLAEGARKCTSAAECFNNPHWKNLWRIPVDPSVRWTDWLFAGDRPLQPAQYPDVPMMASDDIDHYITIPRSQTGQLQAGRIDAPLPPEFNRGMPLLALWVQGNVIAISQNISVSHDGITIGSGGWTNGSLKPYTDRDNKFALMNVPAMVRRPGTFAVSPEDGYAIAWPWTPLHTNFSISARRSGISLARANHAEFRGFTFANYAALPGSYTSGVAFVSGNKPRGIVIADNIFRAAMNLATGKAMVVLLGTEAIIRNNIFTEMPFTSGIQIDASGGPTLVECNQISDIGRTAIRFHNTINATAKANFITRLKSVHGNGITFYGDTRNGAAIDNVVTDSYRPMTMNGGTNYFSSGEKSLYIAGNTFISSKDNGPALVSYGHTQNATVTGNFLSAPETALDLRGTEVGFSATNNTLVGKVTVHNKAQMFDPNDNIYQEADGNGQILTGALSQHGLPEQCRS